MDEPMDELIVPISELARMPNEQVGGKARNLGLLWAAGLPVPPALVITAPAAALDDAARAELVARVDTMAAALLIPQQERLAATAAAVPGKGRVSVGLAPRPEGRASGTRTAWPEACEAWEHQRLAVRSSALLEDRALAAAPGVFRSLENVPVAGLADAVATVWASAQAPLVRAYARAHGIAEVPIAVIVQAWVPPAERGAEAIAGVMYTRPPGQPASESMVLESHARPGQPARTVRIARPEAGGMSAPEADGATPLRGEVLAALARMGMAAESAIGAASGADVEWVAAGSNVWIVQARPIVHPTARPAAPQALFEFSRAQPELVWRWDVTHNPDPLSPAQAGLVERMEEASVAPYRMRVVGGYLYTASAAARRAADAQPGSRRAADVCRPASLPAGTPPALPPALSLPTGEALRGLFEREIGPALTAALAPVDTAGEPDLRLGTALAAYECFYRIYAAVLSPLLSRARRVLPGFLREHAGLAGSDADAVAGQLLAGSSEARLETLARRVARGQASFDELLAVAGPMSPAWDVAAPTFAEHPELLRHAVEQAAMQSDARPASDVASEVRERLSPALWSRFDECLALARVAHELTEIDDQLYARAQAAVRRALLSLARAWELSEPDDIFFVPLEQTVAWAGAQPAVRPDTTTIRRLARAGRAVMKRQRAWVMPLQFANGKSLTPAGTAGERSQWLGRGTGGRARGRVVRVAELSSLTSAAALAEHSLGQAPATRPAAAPDETTAELSAGAIVVAPTITPAMAFWLQSAAAIVAEHGGLLDHGAAMARELGIPCVVDCPGAWAELRTGDELWVDADAGVVIRVR